MNAGAKIASFSRLAMLPAICLLFAVSLTGCASDVQTVNFKINSEPEGSHVVLNISGQKRENSSDWICQARKPLSALSPG
jgi:hypothetical protein